MTARKHISAAIQHCQAEPTSLRLQPDVVHHLDEQMHDRRRERRLRMIRLRVPKLALLDQKQKSGVERAVHP